MTNVPHLNRVAVADCELAVWEWPGSSLPLLFVHATGFHGRCWDQVIAHLPGYHCFAIDLRGHGRSDKPAPPYSWRTLGQDVATVAQTLQLVDALAIGHSVGGYAVALAAALTPTAWSSLLLIDPVIRPRSLYGLPLHTEHFTARRRNHWISPEEMYNRFRDRLPFSRWQPAVLHDYCAYGLVPAPNGHDFVLACPPAIEASIYAGSATEDIYPEIITITAPVQIVRAGQQYVPGSSDMNASPTAPDLATYFPHATDLHLSEYSHLVPMEAPTLIADLIKTHVVRP